MPRAPATAVITTSIATAACTSTCPERVAHHVRGYNPRSVGICDVTTLGKIDIQGRDAGAFLDKVYANTFSTLPVGKVRYGLMLREDGIVMDDAPPPAWVKTNG